MGNYRTGAGICLNVTRRVLLGLISESLLAARPRAIERNQVYAHSFVFTVSGHQQRVPRLQGMPQIWIFGADGHLDLLECGLHYDFNRQRLRADFSRGLFVQHGTWTRQGGLLTLTHPCSRMPPPPGAPPCVEPQMRQLVIYESGTRGITGNVLGPIINPNMRLIAAPDLVNFAELQRVVSRWHGRTR